MTNVYNVTVNPNKSKVVDTGYTFSQGDFGFQLAITVEELDTTGTTCKIAFRKPSGSVEATGLTASGNTYTYTIRGTELDTPGPVVADLKFINSTTQRISTASFIFHVTADTLNGAADTAHSYSDTIQQLVDDLDGSVVKYSEAQTLTDAEKEQARTNIGAESIADANQIKQDLTALENKAVYAKVGKNLFNKDNVTPNLLLLETGETTTNSSYSLGEYIKVDSNKTYTLRYGMRICEYDMNKTYLDGANGLSTNPYTFTTGENTQYVRFSSLNSVLHLEQLEKGESYTSYEAYEESILNDSIFVNGVNEIAGNIDYSLFNQAYVKNGKVVCNDTFNTETQLKTAKYIGVDLKKAISSAEISFGFTGTIASCSIMLITSKLGCERSEHITKGSCHFGVTPYEVIIEYFDATQTLTTTHTHTFDVPLSMDREYKFGWKWVTVGASGYLKVTYPDGETENITDEQFGQYNGQYIMFEHFYTNTSACRGYYTGWRAYGKDSDGNESYLRHDFTHQGNNGILTSAPTGNTYVLFSNDVWGGTQLGYD